MYEDTIDEAIVGFVKSANAGLTGVWLRNAPAGGHAVPPYGTYIGNVTTGPKLRGDRSVMRYSRTAQVDLWQTMAQEQEVPNRAGLLREAFNGKSTVLSSGERICVSVVSVVNVPEPQGSNLVHHSLTIELSHSPQAG